MMMPTRYFLMHWVLKYCWKPMRTLLTSWKAWLLFFPLWDSLMRVFRKDLRQCREKKIMTQLTFKQYQDIILAVQTGVDPEYLADAYKVELVTILNIALYESLNWERLETHGNTHQ